MTPSPQIRDARENDARAVAGVLAAAFREFEAQYTPEAYAATVLTPELILSRIKEKSVLVALESGVIAGTVTMERHGDAAIHVRSMAVLPSRRGCGIAKALLAEVERRAAALGARELVLSSTPFLAAAIRLYNAVGFEEKREGARDLFGTPLVPMRKRL